MPPMEQLLTVGFSTHHLEAIPFLREEMERHDVTVLEEPPTPGFGEMLEGRMPVEDYLLAVDSQFPLFDKAMCRELQRIRGAGKAILQVEPYLEKLLEIHELFASSKTPEDVLAMQELSEVYEKERKATGLLIAFYGASVKDPFRAVLDSVKRFARADAERLLLRERLRAQAIAGLLVPGQSCFVEAGYIHYPLYTVLQRLLGGSAKIRVRHLLEPAMRRHGGKRRNLGPGDVLTLHYSIHGRIDEALGDLLAARSLVYIRLIDKRELLPGDEPAPHCLDEARVNRLVEHLSFADCQRLHHAMAREPSVPPWTVVSKELGLKQEAASTPL